MIFILLLNLIYCFLIYVMNLFYCLNLLLFENYWKIVFLNCCGIEGDI